MKYATIICSSNAFLCITQLNPCRTISHWLAFNHEFKTYNIVINLLLLVLTGKMLLTKVNLNTRGNNCHICPKTQSKFSKTSSAIDCTKSKLSYMKLQLLLSCTFQAKRSNILWECSLPISNTFALNAYLPSVECEDF